MHASSLLPYDPLLGYDNEMFTPQAQEGDVRTAVDGYWNMTDPASLVFAESNGLTPFERIRESDRDRLEPSSPGGNRTGRRPGLLNALVAIAVIAALLCACRPS